MPATGEPFPSAIQTMPHKTFRGVLTRVLSTEPLRTETVAECPHKHRRRRLAVDCARKTLRP